MTKKVAFYTLGCRANQYDTEAMKEKLRPEFEIVPFRSEHHISVINTCTVTTGADRKSRKYLRRAARRGNLVIATGCYSTTDPQKIQEIEGVDLVTSNPDKTSIVQVVRNALSGTKGVINQEGCQDLSSEMLTRDSQHTRAFLKVQDGCNQGCSFCKVWQARGPVRSKSTDHIIEEARQLISNNFKEIVLTGINLAAFDKGGSNLGTLVERLSGLKGLRRIRLSSINPQGITRQLIEVITKVDEFCPHFHIPLQSGSNRILEQMNRGYSRQDYLSTVKLIRDNVTDATFGTDLMVGFPGETKQDFTMTKQILDEVGFINSHIFQYTSRSGTSAAMMSDQVPDHIQKERYHELKDLARTIAHRRKSDFLHRRMNVLLEETSNLTGSWRGFTSNYLDVHLSPSSTTHEEGDIISAKLNRIATGRFEARALRE